MAEAVDLMADPGENPEYDRALFELIARLFPDGQGTADRAEELEVIARRRQAESTSPDA